MSRADATHFQEYKDQTRVKHQILRQYLPPFFNILKKFQNNLVLIDGFAGAGHYEHASTGEKVSGSPLLALELIAASPDLAKRVYPVFIGKRQDHFSDLEASVIKFCTDNSHIKSPGLFHTSFTAAIDGLATHLREGGGELAPTFLFVDPCGVEGADFAAIAEILKRPRCEAFIFFNIDGVRRILGLGQDRIGPTLRGVFGSQNRVDALLASLDGAQSPDEKETLIVSAYLSLLREEADAGYLLPFRVESAGRRVTSHYLIHATKHDLGFSIMKHIMWEAGKGDGSDEGRLELLQASSNELSALMRTDLAQLDDSLVRFLEKNGTTQVRVFREEWVRRPDDLFTDSCYRRRLLQLEEGGVIEVLDDDARTPLPAADRRMTKSGRSLASRLWVRLK